MYTILPKFGFAQKLNPNGYSDYVCFRDNLGSLPQNFGEGLSLPKWARLLQIGLSNYLVPLCAKQPNSEICNMRLFFEAFLSTLEKIKNNDFGIRGHTQTMWTAIGWGFVK